MEDPDFNDPLPPPGAAGSGAAAEPAAGAAPDPEAVSSLTAMGFGEDAAAAALGACGGSLERAADWLFSHMDDLESAVAAAKAAAAGGGAGATGAAGAAAGGGGGAAPAKCGPGRARGDRWGSVGLGGPRARAASPKPWKPMNEPVPPRCCPPPAISRPLPRHPPRLEDGPGHYRLVAIISHMGSSTACGHYVAHVFKGGRWVIFNDEKVGARPAGARGGQAPARGGGE
jgi:ubiquitin carboxyl-terminal hydrolase 5/13